MTSQSLLLIADRFKGVVRVTAVSLRPCISSR